VLLSFQGNVLAEYAWRSVYIVMEETLKEGKQGDNNSEDTDIPRLKGFGVMSGGVYLLINP
jgi:hypothetical protein